MTNMFQEAIDQGAFVTETQLGDLARELGYTALSSIRGARQLSAALRRHGPLFVLGDVQLIITGLRGDQVELFDFVLRKWKSTLLDTFLPGVANRIYAGNLLGGEPEGDFRELKVLRDGYGDVHANHFIGYFRTSNMAQRWIDQFFREYAEVFNLENIASVEREDYRHQGKTVLKFEIDGPPGWAHADYVSLQRGSAGNFFASTLKREWRYALEHVMDFVTPFWTPADAAVDEAYEINSRHFLAGRRSWRLGHVQDDLYYIETAAFERYSHPAYQLAADMGMITRSMLVDIWTNLLNNTMTKYGWSFTDEFARHPTYEQAQMSHGAVYYREIAGSYNAIRTDALFQPIFQRNAGILP